MSEYSIQKWGPEDCDRVERTFELLQNKYTLLLVSAIVLEGEQSFGQLKRSVVGISTKTLSERLKMLVENGVLANRKKKEGNIEKSYYIIACGQKELEDILVAFSAYAKVLRHRPS